MNDNKPRLALGPVLYYWPKQVLLDFYDEIAATPVDIVYLGETICSRRREMHAGDWLALARRLRAAGKQVVLSTLALIEAGSELSSVGKICRQRDSILLIMVHALWGVGERLLLPLMTHLRFIIILRDF